MSQTQGASVAHHTAVEMGCLFCGVRVLWYGYGIAICDSCSDGVGW